MRELVFAIDVIQIVKKFANRYYVMLFGLLFYTSWFYGLINFGDQGNEVVAIAKNGVVLLFMLALFFLIDWRGIKMDLFVTLACFWMAITFFVGLFYFEDFSLYGRRIGQAVFVLLFVTYLRQYPERNPILNGMLQRWFFPRTIFLFLVTLVALTFVGILYEDLISGFGNSRVNLSVWLIQIGVLYCASNSFNSSDRHLKKLLWLLVVISPVYVLQTMTGGRSGMLGTMLVTLFFAYKIFGLKGLSISFAWLFLLTLVTTVYSPIITPESNLNVLRNITPPSFDSGYLSDGFIWLDRLSSYRLSLIVTAFGSMSFHGFLYGVGLGNFLGWAPTYPELGMIEVHNVFLKVFGEFGVFGFLVLVALLIPPLFKKNLETECLQDVAKHVQLIYLVVAMVHPDLMVTAINTSLIYFCFFVLMLSSQKKID